jgi:hypothetical protein
VGGHQHRLAAAALTEEAVTTVPEPSFLTLLKRSFWGLFGAIWVIAGLLMAAIGAANGLRAFMRGEAVTLGALMAVGGAAFAAIGAVLLARGIKSAALEQRLLREGLSAHATVVDVRITNIRFNRRYQWIIEYEYEDRHGVRHRGRSGYLDQDEALAWKAGDAGLIRFDPRDSAVSTWVGRA